jgi:hypothetical protein
MPLKRPYMLYKRVVIWITIFSLRLVSYFYTKIKLNKSNSKISTVDQSFTTPALLSNNGGNHDLAIMTVVKNEGAYLEEWINFHLKQGVQYIYIFNHNSSDNTSKILLPYIKNLQVQEINIDMTTSFVQELVLKHFLAMRPAFRWIMFIDVDEFVYHKSGENLVQFLNKFSQEDCLKFSWRNFGTSNHLLKPEGKVIDNFKYSFVPTGEQKEIFLRSLPDLFKYKSVFNPSRVICENVHVPDTNRSAVDVSEFIFCNHYITKSRLEFIEKIKKIPRPKNAVHKTRLRRFKMLKILDYYGQISHDIDIAK